MVTIRKPKNALKFSHPASWWGSTWREALPTGNGTVGASVYGGPINDTIMITHSDLWWQGHVGVLKDVADKTKEVRKLLDNNEPKKAENILADSLISQGYRPRQAFPLPLCDFKINMPTEKAVKEYARILNMENGEITVTYKDGATKFERSLFVSRANDCIVYEITKSGTKPIDVDFSFDMHEKFNALTPTAKSQLPESVTTKYENYFMYFSARSDNGTEFGAVARINHYGGSQVVTNSGITIKGANNVLVLITPFIESNREKSWKALKTELSANKLTYDKMLKEHTPLHTKLFSSCELDLDGATQRDNFADALLDSAFVDGEVSKALLEKFWAFGRFLLVCSTNPNTKVCAPYGIWCGDYKAVASQITASGTLQSCYAQALTGSLEDYILSVCTYYESVIDDLRKNSSRLFGCRGIFIPITLAHGTGAPGNVESGDLHFVGVAGWISQMFYDYYLITEDTKFLKTRAIPFMMETALFYEEYFKLKGDYYEISPSYSPNTTPGNYINNQDTLGIAVSSTVDFAIAKELLTNLIEASKIAGINKSELPKWEDMLTRIPPYRINSDNTISEYIDSRYNDNQLSNSTSMFYPVYPGREIDSDKSELFKLFSATAKKKLTSSIQNQTSVSLARYANIFARLGEGNLANDVISTIIRCMSMRNMVIATNDWRGMGIGNTNVWATYTIESNMSISSAIQEMLVQSSPSIIRLLPALPDSLSKGEVTSLMTRMGVEVSISWDIKKGLIIAKLKSRKNKTISVILPSGVKKFKAIGKEKVNFETRKVTDLELVSGKPTILELRL